MKVKSSRVRQRRLEILKMDGSGCTKAEIVSQLSKEFACGSRLIYNDIETRASWQPMLQGVAKPHDLVLKIIIVMSKSIGMHV
jgi:hypothetical protein